ncbi:MAG TPA: PhnD/SsuA/transferrin family substrate-binding protein, partial [bacterium]|nr:PhnD/SsuA/transferrin family substrate-binding protein [bacterium]
MEIFKKHPFFAVFLAAVFLAAIACYSLAAASENTQSDKEKIRICFVTGSNPDRVVMQWYPMITYLTDAVGKPFDIIVRDSYEDMLADYRRGEIDLVMGGPFNYVTTKKKAGATLVVAAERGDAEKLKGIIAVRKNSPLKSIE